MSAFWTRGRDMGAENDNGAAAGALAPSWQLTAVDRCDRCGAQAYVRVLLPGRLELLFCAHHNRQYSSALANIAVEIQDETMRLARCALCGILAIRFANRPLSWSPAGSSRSRPVSSVTCAFSIHHWRCPLCRSAQASSAR